MHYVNNPPDATSLMMSARSFGNYDLPGALSDLIDNSIKARAKNVHLECLYNGGDLRVSVLDDGHGMSAAELEVAMRPASTNPLEERSPDDLGRFGWGMKSASFSQCRRLTVISRKDGSLSGAQWDLNDVKNWRMGVLSRSDVEREAAAELREHDGTEIIWSDCDRLSESGDLTETAFNEIVVHARNQIALTFHRYLSGKVQGKKLSITLNGTPIDGYDPFYSDHDATQPLEPEVLSIAGSKIRINPYVLPHYSKLALSEYDRLGGEEGFVRNQGFYVYRNHRLIISGTWFRLIKHGELSQLVRVSVDIPAALDPIWKITVDKSDAQLPTALRGRLKDLVEKLRGRSAKVHRSRGGRIDKKSSIPVWSKHVRHGEITYSINRQHPVIAALVATGEPEIRAATDAAFKVIEQTFPVTTFGEDSARNPNAIHQTEGNPREFLAHLDAMLPLMLAEEEGDIPALVKRLKSAEPYNLNWPITRDFLAKKGWIDGEEP